MAVAPRRTTAIYCATVTLLFGTSALYHRLNWSPRRAALMKRLDHAMIFVFIAGTYTPIAVLTLPTGGHDRGAGRGLDGRLVGVGLQIAWPPAPRWLSAPCYIALGWVAVFVFPDLLHNAGVAAFVLIAVGGVVYTIGGVVYAIKRPEPVPRRVRVPRGLPRLHAGRRAVPVRRHLVRRLR